MNDPIKIDELFSGLSINDTIREKYIKLFYELVDGGEIPQKIKNPRKIEQILETILKTEEQFLKMVQEYNFKKQFYKDNPDEYSGDSGEADKIMENKIESYKTMKLELTFRLNNSI